MTAFRALVGGVAGGLVGVLLWVSVAYFTSFEVGWVAWITGVTTGLGVSAAIERRGGLFVGLLASTIAVGSIGAGKFAMARLATSDAIAAVGDNFTAEDAVYYMAGQDPKAKPGPDGRPDTAAIDRAAAQWSTMSETARDAYRLQAANQIRFEMELRADDITSNTLTAGVGVHDLIWFGLAAASAFMFASRNNHPKHSSMIAHASEAEAGLHPAFHGSSEAESMNPASFNTPRAEAADVRGAGSREADAA